MRSIIFLFILLCILQLSDAKAQEKCYNCIESIAFDDVNIALKDYSSRETIPPTSIIYIDYIEERDTSIINITYEQDISEMFQSGKLCECYTFYRDFLICINLGDIVTAGDSLYLNRIVKLANNISSEGKLIVDWHKKTFTIKNTNKDYSFLNTPLIRKYKVSKTKIIENSWTESAMHQDNYKSSFKYVPDELFEK